MKSIGRNSEVFRAILPAEIQSNAANQCGFQTSAGLYLELLVGPIFFKCVYVCVYTYVYAYVYKGSI